MNTHTSLSTPHTAGDEDGDYNLVEIWLRFDLPRLMAGALAGIFAGAVAMIFAALLCKASGVEVWFPFKVGATIFQGRDAMNFGMNMPTILLGFLVQDFICMVLGIVYAHFTGTNRWDALLGAGFMWGVFSWVFINNLFSRSITPLRELNIPQGPMFFILLVFGFSLVSVRFFDRMICGRRR